MKKRNHYAIQGGGAGARREARREKRTAQTKETPPICLFSEKKVFFWPKAVEYQFREREQSNPNH
jgi:hypothetical protein